MYSSIIAVAVLRSKFKSKPPAAVVEAPTPVVVISTTGIPSMESPEFETYLQSDAFAQLLESEEQMAALMKD
jgi:hypothetical protein